MKSSFSFMGFIIYQPLNLTIIVLYQINITKSIKNYNCFI
jgi:hypothetical protein